MPFQIQCKCGSKEVAQAEERGAGSKFVCRDWPNCPTLPNFKRIIYANSDNFAAKHAIRKFDGLGLNILHCTTAEQVFELLAKDKPKQPPMLVTHGKLNHGEVFTDLQTQYRLRTGIEIYKKLRLEFDPTFPIIILTSDSVALKMLIEIREPFMVSIDWTKDLGFQATLAAIRKLYPSD